MLTSPALDLPYLAPAQTLKYLTQNEALQKLDRLVQMRVERFDLSAPPEGSVPAQALYWTGSSPTGAWADHTDSLASFDGRHWIFTPAKPGYAAVDLSTFSWRIFDGTQWVEAAGAGELPDIVSQLGVGTSADTANRLAVAADASLFTHAGTYHRLTLNRASTSNTASVTFQTDFVAQAEIGLAGSRELSFKISPDGNTFRTAATVDTITGHIGLGAPDNSSRVRVRGNLSVAKHFPAGTPAQPTIFEFTASGDSGAPHTLSRLYSYAPSGYQGNIINAYRGRGLATSAAAVRAGDTILALNALAHHGSGFTTMGQMVFQAATAPDGTHVGGKLTLRLTDGSDYTAGAPQSRVLEIRPDRSVNLPGALHLGEALQLACLTSAELPTPKAGLMAFVKDAAAPAYADGQVWRGLVDGTPL